MSAKKKKTAESGLKIVAKNKKAFHEFEILDRWEAGIVLLGTEVKALREGRCNLGDSYAEIRKGEAGWSRPISGPTITATARTTILSAAASCC